MRFVGRNPRANAMRATPIITCHPIASAMASWAIAVKPERMSSALGIARLLDQKALMLAQHSPCQPESPAKRELIAQYLHHPLRTATHAPAQAFP
jgi:hypothetical protein